MYRAYTVTVPNADLPVSLDRAKDHLNMDDLAHADERIVTWIKSAAANVERQYGMALLTQTVKEYWSAFPAKSTDGMMLRIQPIQSITSVEYIDTDGLTQTWDADLWAYGGYNGATFIAPIPGELWPSTWATPNAVTVTYEAGWGDAESDVPGDIQQAILYMVADYDQKREDSPQTFNRASENLLRPYYRWAA